MNKPLKRHEALIPFSREHHFSLLLCWKIRQGISKNIIPSRIMTHVRWHYNKHIKQHFEAEERHIFPLLGTQDELIQRALLDHRSLRKLIESDETSYDQLLKIEKTLNDHIRFEERVLFKRIESQISTDVLSEIGGLHSNERINDNEEDPFWE
ncbi:MAG: hemerythrin domain-containing protein [Bacteroidetes bacterium]|nr:hemerythrin domain-containing protein [Bacteroidota bacterium]